MQQLQQPGHDKDQAVTAGVKDALRLGCAAIGFTIYPGSEFCVRPDGGVARAHRRGEGERTGGRGVELPARPQPGRAAETALDICAYATQMAALMGANIIKVKPPSAVISLEAAKKSYEKIDAPRWQNASSMSCSARSTAGASWCSPAARRKILDGVFEEVRGVRDGGANGSIIGRNTFQRPKETALEMLNKIIDIYLGKA